MLSRLGRPNSRCFRIEESYQTRPITLADPGAPLACRSKSCQAGSMSSRLPIQRAVPVAHFCSRRPLARVAARESHNAGDLSFLSDEFSKTTTFSPSSAGARAGAAAAEAKAKTTTPNVNEWRALWLRGFRQRVGAKAVDCGAQLRPTRPTPESYVRGSHGRVGNTGRSPTNHPTSNANNFAGARTPLRRATTPT